MMPISAMNSTSFLTFFILVELLRHPMRLDAADHLSVALHRPFPLSKDLGFDFHHNSAFGIRSGSLCGIGLYSC
jgi:hypothetical protein